MGRMLGMVCDEATTADDMASMVVLGIYTTTDASGQQRLISALISVGDRVWCMNTRVSDRIWFQLQTRRDHQIGVQEMLAVLQLPETFENELENCLLLLWIDRGVLGAARKGASKCMEVSLATARAWMKCAELNVDMHTLYVASTSNVADGPSRDAYDEMVRLRATWREPRMPSWLD